MSEPLTKERVLEALKRVKGPDLGADLVSQGLVSEIVINKGKVYYAIKVDRRAPASSKPCARRRRAW